AAALDSPRPHAARLQNNRLAAMLRIFSEREPPSGRARRRAGAPAPARDVVPGSASGRTFSEREPPSGPAPPPPGASAPPPRGVPGSASGRPFREGEPPPGRARRPAGASAPARDVVPGSASGRLTRVFIVASTRAVNRGTLERVLAGLAQGPIAYVFAGILGAL